MYRLQKTCEVPNRSTSTSKVITTYLNHHHPSSFARSTTSQRRVMSPLLLLLIQHVSFSLGLTPQFTSTHQCTSRTRTQHTSTHHTSLQANLLDVTDDDGHTFSEHSNYLSRDGAMTRRGAMVAGASLSSLVLIPTQILAREVKSTTPSPDVKLQTGYKMPLISYSFYKTAPELSERALALALRAGVRHFDLATDYESFDVVAASLRQYWAKGKTDWTWDEEKEEVLQKLDDARRQSDGVYKSLNGKTRGGKQQRRKDMFLTYKLSNDEQTTDPNSIRRTVQSILTQLDTTYLDLVCLHSPLTDASRRLATFETLLQLKEAGHIHSIGVCNYGMCHLKELTTNNLPLPSVNQLELSPFNTHEAIVRYCEANNIVPSCAAWSRLSSADGPVEQWATLGGVAKEKGVTKAQVLVRWALQHGYGCAPRSGTKSKLEVSA
jgi:diketogulonate reductase-like aldo/keto reductase